MVEIAPTDVSAAGLRRIAALLREVFPNARGIDPEYLGWDYALNPMGTAVAFDARDGDAVVAHMAGRALVARFEGREERGLLIHHAATLEAQRRQGRFGALLEAIAEAGSRTGFTFLVAVANARSAPVFVARHGFQPLGPLDVALGVGLPPRWEEAAPTQLEPVWNPDPLAWRLRRPGADYRVRRLGDSAQLLARTARFGPWMELAWLPAHTLPPQLRALTPALRLGAWIGLEARRREGLWPAVGVPLRLRPSPLELIFRDLAGQRRLERGLVAFRALDFDAY